MRTFRAERGIALLFSLAVLGVLSILTLAFVKMSQLERNISRQYLDKTRAMITAESGVESAMAHIRTWRGRSVLEFQESLDYNPSNPAVDVFYAEDPSLESAIAPPVGFPGGAAASGYVGNGTYVANGDFYKLKIRDTSGLLNLNDSNAVMDNGQGRLDSMINSLSKALFGWFVASEIVAELIPQRDAEYGGAFSTLTEVRDVLTQDRGALPPVLTEDQYNEFEKHITLNSWVDPNVLHPHPAFDSATGVANALGLPGDSGFAQTPSIFNYPTPLVDTFYISSLTDFHLAYGDDVYMPSQFSHKGLELDPRAPINVNTASVELLQAVFEGVQGTYLYEYGHESFLGMIENATERASASEPASIAMWTRNTLTYNLMMQWPCGYGSSLNFPSASSYWYRPFSNFEKIAFMHDCRLLTENRQSSYSGATLGAGSIRRTVQISDTEAADLAQAMHDRIHGATGRPFVTWQDFRNFLYSYYDYYGNYWTPYNAVWNDYSTDQARPGLERKYMADALLANCCPNADLNDFNPNATMFRHVDKNDLLTWTTELCFESTGIFDIESEAYILGADGSVQASARIQCVTEGFRTARITTQSQFFPAPPDQMISRQHEFFGVNETPYPTAGADSPVADPAARYGTLTQSYPESLSAGDTQRIANSIYDGCVCLSTYQLNGLLPNLSFRASFNGTLDADEARGDKTLFNDPVEQPDEDTLMYAWGDTGKDVGNLFADGGYSEAYRTLIYHSQDNFGAIDATNLNHPYGTLAFWYKPNWQPERSTRVRQLFSISSTPKAAYYWTPSDITNSNIGDPYYTRKSSDFALWYFPVTPCPAPGSSAGGYGSTNQGPLLNPVSPQQGNGFFNNALSHKLQIRNMPNRFFMFNVSGGLNPGGTISGGIGSKGNMLRAVTDAVNFLDFPKPGSYAPDRDKFRAHRWTFFALSWKFADTAGIALQVNDWPLPGDDAYIREENYWGGSYSSSINNLANPWVNAVPPTTGSLLQNGHTPSAPIIAPIGTENPMRFGEYQRGIPNFSSDGTYDEIVSHRFFAEDAGPTELRDAYYTLGRFYNPAIALPATYQTGAINKDRLRALSGSEVMWGNDSVTLRSVSWTCWWPDTWMLPNSSPTNTDPLAGTFVNRNIDRLFSTDMNPNDDTHPYHPDHANPVWEDLFGYNIDPSDKGNNERPQWDPVTVDVSINGNWMFADNAATEYPRAAEGKTGMSNAGGSYFIQPNGAPIRLSNDTDNVDLKFFFNLTNTEPLHDSPALDDITLTFYFTKPRILTWRIVNP